MINLSDEDTLNRAESRRSRWLAFIIITIILSGCGGERTERLIDYIDPEGMVVVQKEEAQLIVKAMNRNEYIILSNGNYLVHKSKLRTFGDYTIIAAATPVTIAIDSAMYMVEGAAKILATPSSGGSSSGSNISIPLPFLLFE